MYIGFRVKYVLFLADFSNLHFLDRFSKNIRIQISWKSVQWEPSCSMRTGGRTDRRSDMTKLIVAFRNFANTPKN